MNYVDYLGRMECEEALPEFLEKMAAGETFEQILEAHPRLTYEAIRAAIAFAAAVLRADVVYPTMRKEGDPVRKLNLKESRPPYNVSLDDALLAGEVVILEKEGRPVAALVPMAEYTVFQTWREEERRCQARQAEEAAIEREHATFQQMLPELLKQYEGRVVAIHNGRVVAVGDDKMELWTQTRQELGDVPVYVQIVEYPPRVYDMPSIEVIADVDL